MTPKRPVLTALLILLLLGFYYNLRVLNQFPKFIHTWTQSDRYALSLGFVNNNLNFFKPETYVYNQQYPNNLPVISEESITAVDFPIHEYIPAVFMKIFGDRSPLIFQLYMLIYSVIGLLFVYKLAFLWTKDFYRSLFIALFAATSPVLVYYQAGFLPSIPSMANSAIGIYFYSLYLNSSKKNDFNLAIIFLTLATLARTTFLIPLVAVIGLEFLSSIKTKTFPKQKLFTVLTALAIFFGYYLYNGYLRNKYGSIFLNFLLPPSSGEHAIELIKAAKNNWGTQYFSNVHYYVALAIIVISAAFLIVRKHARIINIGRFALLSGFILIGYILFAAAMLVQFQYHDYYFIDSFYLPLIYLLIILIALIPVPATKIARIVSLVMIILICFPMFLKAAKVQMNRRVEVSWDKWTISVNAYHGAKRYLDSLQVAKDAKILILDACAPNIALPLIERKGFVVMHPTKEKIQTALDWDYDYIVFQNENFIKQIYNYYPEVLQHLKKIGDNSKITLCTYSDAPLNQSIYTFSSTDGKLPVYFEMMSFDGHTSDLWYNVMSSAEKSFSGTQSGIFNEDVAFGLTFETKSLKEITTKNRTLVFSSMFFHQLEKVNDLFVVISLKENNNSVYYRVANLSEFFKSKDQWNKVEMRFELPKVNSEKYQLSVYLWNTGKNKIYYDDFAISLF